MHLKSDAFLRNSEEILSRLFLSAFNLSEDSAADYWCGELNRRLPRLWPSATCRLMVMGWSSSATPNIAEADEILQNALSGEAPYKRERLMPRLEALRAAVVARAGGADAARAILHDIDETTDTELLGLEAAVLIRLGDHGEAAKLLAKYDQVGPGPARQRQSGRMFRGLPRI